MMEAKNAIRMIAPFANEPTPLLWDILLQIVRYVKGAKQNSVKSIIMVKTQLLLIPMPVMRWNQKDTLP
jgi:hypothetical protein